MKYKYKPTQKAVNSPVRMLVNKHAKRSDYGRMWVGVGGSVTIEYKAPKKEKVIPEATQEQYAILWYPGSKLIERVEIQEKETKTE